MKWRGVPDGLFSSCRYSCRREPTRSPCKEISFSPIPLWSGCYPLYTCAKKKIHPLDVFIFPAAVIGKDSDTTLRTQTMQATTDVQLSHFLHIPIEMLIKNYLPINSSKCLDQRVTKGYINVPMPTASSPFLNKSGTYQKHNQQSAPFYYYTYLSINAIPTRKPIRSSLFQAESYWNAHGACRLREKTCCCCQHLPATTYHPMLVWYA